MLDKEGIAVEIFASDPKRPNIVARLKGNGRKRPLLIMGHSDVVTVDPKKWTFPPFSATRDGGYVYGRGTVDDKDNLAAGLMTMLMLKRLNVPLDRDVIFLVGIGRGREHGGRHRVHGRRSTADAIDAEYCLAEGGGVTRIGGEVQYATVQAGEKIPRGIELVATGPSGHGSVPLQVERHRAPRGGGRGGRRVARADVRLNETTAHLLPQPGDDLAAGGRGAVPRRAVDRDPKARMRPTTTVRATSRALRRCCGPRCRRRSSPAATART